MTDKNKRFEQLTPEELKDLKIEFAPGAFDNFDGTQEELDGLIAEIQRMITDGSILENSREITDEDFDDLPPEVQEQLARAFLDPEDQDKIPNSRKLQ